MADEQEPTQDLLPPVDPPPGRNLPERLRELQERALARLQKFEPTMALEWASSAFQKQSTGFYFRLITIFLCTYIFSDLAALIAGRYIPEPPAPRGYHFGGGPQRGKSLENYSSIFSRNLFNSRGLIPGEETGVTPVNMGGTPVKSTLPLNLIGTLVLRDELRSIATIEDKSASIVYPVRVDDEIPSKAKITKIEKNKVIFVNSASHQLEYIDIPEDLHASNARISLGTRKAGGPMIEQVGGNQYNISRQEVDKQLSDLNNILTQARAVPNFENGLPAGYKLFQIVPGSIYDKLGLKNGDVIAGLDGQPINDPGKAFEMLSRLKEASHLELQVKREGRQSTFSFDIH